MSALKIAEKLRVWLRQPAAVKLLVWLGLSLALSAIFFRGFWSSLPVMLSPDWIFGQYNAAPWGVLALCLLFLWLKRKSVWADMDRRTNLAYGLLGTLMFMAAVLVPFSTDFLVFQVLLASLGVLAIFFGPGSRLPAVCLGIYGLAVVFPLFIERFAQDGYSRTAIAPVMWLLTALGYPLHNQGQWVEFASKTGEQVSVTITAACAGPATMGVFIALFALMTLDVPLSPRRAAWTFLFGVFGTWLQSLIRLVILLLVGYYLGESALWTAHLWTIYLLFPAWFLVFVYIYMRQARRPRQPSFSGQPAVLPALGG